MINMNQNQNNIKEIPDFIKNSVVYKRIYNETEQSDDFYKEYFEKTINIESYEEFIEKKEIYKNKLFDINEEKKDYLKIINPKYIVKNTEIKNIDDLYKLIEVIRYWDLNKIPDSIYDFVILNKDIDYNLIYEEFKEMPICEEIKLIVGTKLNCDLETSRYHQCAQGNLLDLTKYLINKRNNFNQEFDVFIKIAIQYADLKYFKYLHKVFEEEGKRLHNLKLEDSACKFNKLDILKFLFEKEYKIDPRCINKACQAGNLRIIKFLNSTKKYTLTSRDLNSTIFINNFECIKYVCDQLRKPSNKSIGMEESTEKGTYINQSNLALSAEIGEVRILKYILEKSKEGIENPVIIWNRETTYIAAIHGNLECLKYLHNIGCSWDHTVCINAAKNGHLDCLKYALENGCPIDGQAYGAAKKYNQTTCLNYLINNNCPIGEYYEVKDYCSIM